MEVVLKDVNKSIRGSKILSDINLELNDSKIYGLKGKNGSGKTMLMRMISGLIIPNTGKVQIDGEELGKDISFPRSVGLLIENPSFLNEYTGYDNLKMLAGIKKIISDEQVKLAMGRVGLEWNDKRNYRKYSLGMKQRLGIAAAIMEAPDLIILDEPINALDESGVELVRTILEQEKKRGALIIVACHDKEELELLSDEIIEISEGRIINQ